MPRASGKVPSFDSIFIKQGTMEDAAHELRRAAIPDTLRHAALRLVQDGETTIVYNYKAQQLRAANAVDVAPPYTQLSIATALKGTQGQQMITVVHVVDAVLMPAM